MLGRCVDMDGVGGKVEWVWLVLFQTRRSVGILGMSYVVGRMS